MTELDDHELLAEFARTESETAFAALVARQVNLVYSAALRFTGNPHHAEEITQAVFLILARKAGSLSPRVVLSGWLYQTARLTAANFLKGEIRRQQREQEAYMQTILNEPDAAAWKQIAPMLDEAMGRLGETDRNAVVLRFFENKTASETGALLKMNEGAVHKRVHRALGKLRKIFSARGVTLPAAVIAGVVAANSVQAAPAGVAVTVTAAVKGAAISTATTTLVKGTLKIMTHAKFKLAIGIAAGILLAGGATTLVISQTGGGGKLTPRQIAKQSQDAYAALSSYSDSGTVVTEAAGQTSTTTFNTRLQRPDLYRIDWTQTSEGLASKGAVWSDGSGDYLEMETDGQEQNAPPQKMQNMQMAFGSATGISSSATSIPATFYKQNFGEVLSVPASGRWPLEKERDENVGDVGCHVFSCKLDAAKMTGEARVYAEKAGSLGTTTTTLWIGRQDHLIHKSRTITEGMSLKLPPMSDDKIKTILEAQNKPATPEAIAAMRTQLEAMMKKAQGAKFIFTQTHENIVVNQKFSPADFAR
jgi:RNA polymerase sigma factor (sigma-70 family)